MQIQSTRQATLAAKASAPRTPVAELDQSLAAGTVPEDIFVMPSRGGRGSEVVRGNTPGAIPLQDGSESVKDARGRERLAKIALAPAMMLPGAMLGSLGVPGSPLVGAAVGAGIGLAFALDTGNEFRGKVKVDHDGEKGEKPWYRVGGYEKNGQELHTILHAKGVLGDRVVPVAEKALEGTPSAEAYRAVAPFKGELKTLADERRLLADLGGETRYGKPALQLVNAGTAREFLARGKSVHVVDVEDIREKAHHLNTEAFTGDGSTVSAESFQYTEREIRYSLQEIRNPEQLKELKEGTGLPDSTPGLARDESCFTQTVYNRHERGNRTVSKGHDNQNQTLEEVLRGGTNYEGPRTSPVSGALRNMVDPSTKGYAVTGAVLGAAAGMAIPGMEAAVGATLGGVAGHFVGRAAVKRSRENRELEPLGRKLLTGAGMAVGVGLGILAAQQTGDVAMSAGGLLGCAGGFFSGVLASKHLGTSSDLAVGAVGLGGAVGIANALMGPNLPCTLALGALGAAAGWGFATLATVPKGKLNDH